jgi:hypothetical protein
VGKYDVGTWWLRERLGMLNDRVVSFGRGNLGGTHSSEANQKRKLIGCAGSESSHVLRAETPVNSTVLTNKMYACVKINHSYKYSIPS